MNRNVHHSRALLSSCAAFFFASLAPGQIADSPDDAVAGIPVNYTEAKVGSSTLPDPLMLAAGEPVRTAATWFERRRPEILRLFEQHQFGRSPGPPQGLRFEVFDRGSAAFEGKATRKQVTVHFSGEQDGPKMDLLVYTPAAAKQPSPLLLNVGFTANSLMVDDPGVKPGEIWNRERQRVSAAGGRRFGRLDVARLVGEGFGVATVYYADIDPDFPGGLPHGVRSLYLKPGQAGPEPDEWGAIAAWAWGISRAVDYFETDPAVDAKRIAILGVSRLGKTVLWAAARDPRIAAVIASCSGEGGAALSRRNYGETIAHLAHPTRYAYQFCANYGTHGGDVNTLPVDGHMLLSLIAPRPVLLQTGSTDKWSDPYGEFLAAVAAGPVYELLGRRGLETTTMPPAGEPILHDLGYFMHEGGHGSLPGDWDVFLRFLAMHLK